MASIDKSHQFGSTKDESIVSVVFTPPSHAKLYLRNLDFFVKDGLHLAQDFLYSDNTYGCVTLDPNYTCVRVYGQHPLRKPKGKIPPKKSLTSSSHPKSHKPKPLNSSYKHDFVENEPFWSSKQLSSSLPGFPVPGCPGAGAPKGAPGCL